MDPVVVQVTPPHTPFRLPHLPNMGGRGSRILTAVSAVVICLSMILFAVVSVLTNNGSFQKSHSIHNINVPSQVSGSTLSSAAAPGGGTAIGRGSTTGTNSPAVTLSATPASVNVGGKTNLKWSVTNNPLSCVASNDWSGTKASSGAEDSPALTKVQTYYFTLTCKTKTGTGTSSVAVGASQHIVVSGNPQTAPVVTIAAAKAGGLHVGDSTQLTWNVTNNPTACTASGDWSGAQPTSNSTGWTVGPFASAKQYKFTLTCQNSTGVGASAATVDIQATPPDLPLTSLSSNPVGPVTPGSTVVLTWKLINTATSCAATGDWSGAKNPAGGSETSVALTSQRLYTFNIECSNSTGSTTDSAAILVLPNFPSVSLTVSPNSMFVGNAATISYSSTNSPTTCTASGDWSGAKTTTAGTQTQSTGTINTARTYLYSLACTNARGTGFQNNVPLTVTVPPAPVVSLSASPIATTTGNSSTLTWSATNNPTSCTASGDWTGAKAASGTQSSGALSTVKTYSYSLSCTNAGGTNNATTSVDVSANGGTVVAPAVSITASPAQIGTGSSSTISWSATNNPTSCTASGSWSGAKSGSGSQSTGSIATAGTYTYTLACSNSAGSNSKSATLTVLAIPAVSIALSPTSINTGSTATITWSATNSPTSCTAGGSWTGSKAASGSQTTGAMNTAGSFSFSLSCVNSGGTGTGTATLTVANAAPVYCGGLSPCYGPTYMSTHASVGNCYAWNSGSGSAYPWILNITSFRPNHPGGQRSGSLEETTSVCNHDIHNILAGSASIPSYKDSSGSTTHSHQSSTQNNSGSSVLSSYRVGYYDPASPN